MLDEKALRKPEFTEGFRIVLADGQSWSFPEAVFRLFPVVDPSGTVSVGGRRSYGKDHDQIIDALMGGEDVEEFERLRLRFSAAVSLISRNYDLTPEDMASLLVLDRSRPETIEAWAKIDRIILGLPPEDDDPPKP